MKHLRHYQGCFDNSNASVGFSTAALYKRYCDAFLQFVMSSLLNGLTITQRTATFLNEQRTFCLSEQLISPTTSWHIFCKYPPNVFDANASCRLIHVVINPERIDIREKVYL